MQEAVKNWERLKPVILDGEQYRLVSPYETNHCAINYISQDKGHAVVFAYNLHPRYKEPLLNVRMQGLDANKQYTIEEINLMPGTKSKFDFNGKTFSGDFLMKSGLNMFEAEEGTSHVFELK